VFLLQPDLTVGPLEAPGGLLMKTLLQHMKLDNPIAIKDAANDVFVQAERRGQFPRCSAFMHDYHKDYPQIAALEQNFDVIRDECLALIGRHKQFTDMSSLSSYTSGGVHAIDWKSYMFKTGQFVEKNCARAPKTTVLLSKIPGLYTAFYSILDPHQYIKPHWGYWKGFLRYHLAIIVPKNNEDKNCWLRVNPDRDDNDKHDRALIENGEKYYWKVGEGVMFDDTFLHDAANESDVVRVVLFLDVRRKMPMHLQALNIAMLEIGHRLPAVAQIRKNAVIELD
jgi:ornithine lipid ester-linked acyl 2-hydroxylase